MEKCNSLQFMFKNLSSTFTIFYMHLGKAVLQYENEGNNTMNMYHTMVPSEYRGKGIAGHLAKVSGNKWKFIFKLPVQIRLLKSRTGLT